MKKTTPRKPSEIIQYYFDKRFYPTSHPDAAVAIYIDSIVRYLDERAKLCNREDELMLPWEMNEEEKPKKLNKKERK